MLAAAVNVLGALAVAVLLPACDGTLDLPADRTWSSAHFDYHTRASDRPICADILGPLEQHFALFEDYFGFVWPAGRKIEYEKFVDTADYQAHAGCPGGTLACTAQGGVMSPNGIDLHELVHAYLWPTGRPPTVLVEGAAVALSCTSADYAAPKPAYITWDQLASVPTAEAYPAGAWLVGYLLDQFGPQRFLALYGALRQDADAATMDAVVRSLYGQGLSDIWNAALSESQPRNTCLWQCAQPAFPLDGTPLSTTGVCGVSALASPFSLEVESTVGFTSTHSYVEVRSCGQVPLPDAPVAGGGTHGLLALYHLPAGSYFLAHEPVGGTLTGTAEPEALLTPSCAAATDTAPLVGEVFLTLPSSQPDWFLPLPAPPPDGQLPSVSPASGALGVGAICASCDLSTCASPLPTTPWQTGQVLHVATDIAQPFNQVQVSWYY
jgi:hypothetical protein